MLKTDSCTGETFFLILPVYQLPLILINWSLNVLGTYITDLSSVTAYHPTHRLKACWESEQ